MVPSEKNFPPGQSATFLVNAVDEANQGQERAHPGRPGNKVFLTVRKEWPFVRRQLGRVFSRASRS